MLNTTSSKKLLRLSLVLTGLVMPLAPAVAAPEPAGASSIGASEGQVRYRSMSIDGVEIAYREADRADAPAILLLHGFPTSSHMFRTLIPALSDRYRVIAPDYPGFGQSAAPERSGFKYTFDNFAALVDGLTKKLGLSRYALYVMDYGAPVGFRLAARHPDRVTAIVVQNGNAYTEGLKEFWGPIKKYWASGSKADREAIRWLTSLKATKWQYTHGVPDTSLVSPDTWTGAVGQTGQPGDPVGPLLRLSDQRAALSRMAGLFPHAQAGDTRHLGQERSDLRGRRRGSLQA